MSADTALVAAINRLRQYRNAVILAHYYQEPEIQDIADFVGDSLELSRKAASTDADVIVFCGVHFMAETAKILSPQKTVVLPDLEAGCSLADDCPADEFARFRAEHPDHFVVSYINCTAAEHDHVCIGAGGLARQLQGVTNEIGDVLNLRLLVVVRQDHGIAVLAKPVDRRNKGGVSAHQDRFRAGWPQPRHSL